MGTISIDQFDPNTSALVEQSERTSNPDGGYTLAMPWVGFMGGETVRVPYNSEGVQQSIDAKGLSQVAEGVALVRRYWTTHESADLDQTGLPSTAEGN